MWLTCRKCPITVVVCRDNVIYNVFKLAILKHRSQLIARIPCQEFYTYYNSIPHNMDDVGIQVEIVQIKYILYKFIFKLNALKVVSVVTLKFGHNCIILNIRNAVVISIFHTQIIT